MVIIYSISFSLYKDKKKKGIIVELLDLFMSHRTI